MNVKRKIYFTVITTAIMLFSCVKSKEFDIPNIACSDSPFDFISISDLKSLYSGETFQIQEDLVVQGYVISSDKEGNFFNIIHFQDKENNPLQGLQIELELRDSHLFFDVGQQIFIKLKGLYLGESNGVYKIGGVFSSFGNLSVGRLPKNIVFDHVLVSCESNVGVEPISVSISELDEKMVNTLVKINDVEFQQDELGETFAISEEETLRTLVDCNDNEMFLINSGYSNFQSDILPEFMGTATGILTIESNEFGLMIRSTDDLNFDQKRCEDLVDEFTSSSILISEIADPNNNAGARFVELYNTSAESLSLKGWTLIRYTNDNTEVSSSIDLSEFEMKENGFLVISPNSEEFENIYGFAPDVSVGTNSPADSNGDDTIVLIDPFGNLVDIFGVIGEDGSNTNHEFEDGRALRNIGIVSNSSVFNSNEWTIYNDTGEAGTINLPQNAPLDFTPNER
ncbi:DUF5689 domain-containing protein [Maribacter sp. Asnod1-A12]|uniref:DUF5689 domain-containing protein n=1 Tax=Maribacter sp. Asnod1-A12 TaxID=3160576 RepID=UPI00386642D4